MNLENLMKRYGGLKNIPQKELDKINKVVIEDIDAGLVLVNDKKEYDSLYEKCSMLMEEYGDYLYSHDREDIALFMQKKRIIREEQIESCLFHAQELRNAGIPGFRKPEYEGTTSGIFVKEGKLTRKYVSFPTVDFILKFGSGWYFYERKIKGMTLGKRGGYETNQKSYLIGRASLKNILYFRKFAFEKENIQPLLSRYLEYWYSNKFNIQDKNRKMELINYVISVVECLNEDLKNIDFRLKDIEGKHLIDTSNHLVNYAEEHDISPLIRKNNWFLNYSEEDRTRIVEKYAEIVVQKGSPVFPSNAKNKKLFEIMKFLFPTEFYDLAPELEYNKALFADSLEKEDLSFIPARIAIEPIYEKEQKQLTTFIRDSFFNKVQKNKGTALMSIQKLSKELKVSQTILILPEYNHIVNQLRYIAAKKFSDKEFLEAISGGGTYPISKLGFVGKERTEASEHFHDSYKEALRNVFNNKDHKRENRENKPKKLKE